MFYTKAGTTKLPLDGKLFKVDLAGSSITITGTDPKMAGTYTVYFDVALVNYPSNVKSTTTPFKVTVTKPNTAPTLSELSKKQSMVQLEIPKMPAEAYFIPTGNPVDAENDKVSIEFENGGEAFISYDKSSGQIVVSSGIIDGAY